MRKCGPCTECCFAVGVPELLKGPHVRCEHVTPKGCGIYSKRPESCQEFSCVWLEDGTLHRKDRPDKVGIVLATQNTPHGAALAAFITKAGADEKGRGKELLDKWSKRFLIFVAKPDGSRSVMGPAEIVSKISVIEECGVGGEKTRHNLRVLN